MFEASAWPGLLDFLRARRGMALSAILGVGLFGAALLPLGPPSNSLLRQASFTLAGLALFVGWTSGALQLRRTRYVITSHRAGRLAPGGERWVRGPGLPQLRPGRVFLSVVWEGLTFELPTAEEPALRAVLTELGSGLGGPPHESARP